MTAALTALRGLIAERFNTLPSGGTWYSHGSSSPTVVATLTFNPNGTITFAASGGGSASDASSGVPTSWAAGPLLGAYVRVTVLSGALASGTTGSFAALSSAQTWTITRGSPGFAVASLQFDFSRDGSTVAATLTASLEAGIS